MAYEWPRNLCNGQGVPYEKMPSVYLEKTGVNGDIVGADTFCTQAEVDAAWEEGYHSPGKPWTRDVDPPAAPKEAAPIQEETTEIDTTAGPDTELEMIPAGPEEFIREDDLDEEETIPVVPKRPGKKKKKG